MLVIRETQMAAFEQAALRNFENRLLGHLEEFFPKHREVLGEEQMRKVIRLGIERAESYGLVSERDLHLYVGLMFMLGSYFDQDPQLPWATKILTDENIIDPSARADRLHDRAMAFLNEAAGQESQFLERALRKARELPTSALSRSGEDRQLSFGDHMLKLLHAWYPEKYQAVSDPVIRQLIRQGYQVARGHGLTDEKGIAVYLGLMFLLGGGFDRDPQHPWAEAVLRDATLIDPVKKGESLHQSAMAHLEQWLA
jgi:predicted transcriptional regulator